MDRDEPLLETFLQQGTTKLVVFHGGTHSLLQGHHTASIRASGVS